MIWGYHHFRKHPFTDPKAHISHTIGHVRHQNSRPGRRHGRSRGVCHGAIRLFLAVVISDGKFTTRVTPQKINPEDYLAGTCPTMEVW